MARLFRDDDCLNPNTGVSYLPDSRYVGHFGASCDFCKKTGGVIDLYGELKERLVFINDGATWIREWIADHCPLAVSIPDFYHAAGYLYDFADKLFPDDPSEKEKWCERQKELLLASEVETVLDNICSTKTKEEDKKKISSYIFVNAITTQTK